MGERASDLRRAALALAAVTALAVAAGACGRSSLFRGEDGIPLDTFGGGQDGDLVVASLADGSSDCRLLRATQDSALNAAGAASFEQGDMLLLWQVKGFAAVSGSANELANPGDAGRFEMLRAISVSSSRVVVEHTPSILYKTSGNHVAQVCRVPEYDDVTIGASGALIARPWDSSVGTGGVISFLVKGTLLLFGSNSAVIASGRGMAGGLGIDGDTCPGTVDLDAGGNPNCAGRKGEGIDAASYGPQRYGRGNRANGGGGGSGADGGGGGGGNGGAGGEGGQNFQGSPGSEGAGGTALLTTDLRLFFGGGGGAGHADDQPGRDGARGGGVVLIYARRIAGPGRIAAAGQGAADAPVNSGGAGGGAGGTIAIVVSSSTFSGVLDARGGAGSFAVTGGHGPGGGGGGGRIDLRGGLVVGTAQVVLAGGAGGVDGGAVPRGATSGSAGNLVLEP